MNHPHYLEEIEHRFGPKLWDADPDVCCAAYQLGACPHTEAYDPEDYHYDDEDYDYEEGDDEPTWDVPLWDGDYPF